MDFEFPVGLESPMPEFDLEIYDPKTDEVLKRTLSDFNGKRFILFFYPADFTFVCPTELKDLNQQYDKIKKLNAEIMVVSTDTVFSHKRRVETEWLLKWFSIPMISDRTTDLSNLFNALNPITWNSERTTVIISPEWIIKWIEMVTEPLGRSSSELVRKIEALEFIRQNPGQACPSSRNTWEKSLKPSIKIAWKVQESLE